MLWLLTYRAISWSLSGLSSENKNGVQGKTNRTRKRQGKAKLLQCQLRFAKKKELQWGSQVLGHCCRCSWWREWFQQHWWFYQWPEGYACYKSSVLYMYLHLISSLLHGYCLLILHVYLLLWNHYLRVLIICFVVIVNELGIKRNGNEVVMNAS